MSASTASYVRPEPVWCLAPRDPEKEAVLQRELGISGIVAALLIQRGMSEPAAAHRFLHPSLSDLGDPSQLPDFEPAVAAILGARERGELIYVHGDYDVDGITSSAMFDRFLANIGCRVHTHVPHRILEGYGIHVQAVRQARDMGAKLFLTCDCGISAHEQVSLAREYGMAVVVTDHHEIADSVPEADAVVNPHRRDSLYPERLLSGAGVVFRLCEGLTTRLGYPVDKFRRAYLDLACLGTIADVMPLVGENRIIAKFGLTHLSETKKAGLRALMREARVGEDPSRGLQATDVGWRLGPRLNAAGRLEDAAIALRLLTERDEAAATELAKALETINVDRRSRTQVAVDEATQMVLEQGYFEHAVIVVASRDWHPGIVGIVAGRLVERFCRPVLAVTINDETGVCKGSARSISAFHFAEAIWALPELLSGGGHSMAAGCSFRLADLDGVREALHRLGSGQIAAEDLVPRSEVDLHVGPGELSETAVHELKLLEPFGFANAQPVFMARAVTMDQILPTRNPAHVRFKLGHGADKVAAIGFNVGERLPSLPESGPVDVLFHAELNEFRGAHTLQWQIRDLRPADSN